MSARTRSAPYIERSEHLHASCNSQHDELSDFLNERKRTQRRPRNSIEHPQPQNYPVFAQHVRVMAMSEWKRIEDLVVDKLEADVGNGAQKQVAADEEVDRFDRPADAATHLTHGAQHAFVRAGGAAQLRGAARVEGCRSLTQGRPRHSRR
eukprot:scaffold9333_cov119-Isochrysis_galbana.AAC.4